MNNFVILSIMNAVSISFCYHVIRKNMENKQVFSYEDIKKRNNKQLLLIFILSGLGTYGCFYIFDNKLLDNISTSEMEVKGGEPNF